MAADKGIEEWGAVWNVAEGPETDDGDAILKLMNDVYSASADDDEPEIALPPIDVDAITLGTASFRADTGIGVDWLPPRLVSRLSRGAKVRLASILTGIEKKGRWPSCIRAVVEVALAKKTGGGAFDWPGALPVPHLVEGPLQSDSRSIGSAYRPSLSRRGAEPRRPEGGAGGCLDMRVGRREG